MAKNFIKIALVIICLIITAFLIYKLYKEYKKSETIDEKVTFWLILIIFIIPLIIFYFDYYNIASKFSWVHHDNVNRWFEFISTYFSTIVGAAIGAIALILMTIKQMNLQREKDNEDRRIQNMPLLSYTISDTKLENSKKIFLLNEDSNFGNNYNLYFKIENSGLNHARNIFYKISDNNEEICMSKLEINQSIIKKNESICLDFVFNYKYDKINKNNNRKIEIIIYYEDLLNNYYSQRINLCLEITNKSGYEYGGYAFYIIDTTIEKENYCKKYPVKKVKGVNTKHNKL